MKKANEILKCLPAESVNLGMALIDEDGIRAIQADALRHASRVVDKAFFEAANPIQDLLEEADKLSPPRDKAERA